MTRKISDILVTFAAARYQRLERLCGSRVALDYRSKYDKAFPCAVSLKLCDWFLAYRWNHM